jgi:DNA-binding PadR family transcriptional regulator
VSSVFGHGHLRLYLLGLLAESPRHGYDIIRALADRFHGLYAPSAGTVYPRLARLEAEGLVTSEEEGERKIFTITPAGRAELEARQRELDGIEDDITASVRELGREIREGVRGSVEGLRRHLKTVIREQRREEARRTRAFERPIAEIERMARQFRRELRDLARRSAPTESDVLQVKRALQAASDEARRVLRRG